MTTLNRIPRAWLAAIFTATSVILLVVGMRLQFPDYRPRLAPIKTSKPLPPQEAPQHDEASPPPATELPSSVGKNSSVQLLDDTKNATLGFEKLLVINFPSRTDKRDRMTLMGVSTGLSFSFLPAADAASVPDAAMPPKAAGWQGKVRGSWRGHMDALWYIVNNNLTTAVILEDDLDWDIRIRDQARDFAIATRALLQPLTDNPKKFADPTYPSVQEQDKQLDPRPLDFDRLPQTRPPLTSAYGDDWDLLWLGHCGVQQPIGNPKDQWAERSRNLSRGSVLRQHDPTVPQSKHIHSWDDAGHARFRNTYASHSRLTHHSLDAVCTFAYAVTQAGARKILYELGLWKMVDPFDLGLRQFCDGIMGHERHIKITCRQAGFCRSVARRVNGANDPPGTTSIMEGLDTTDPSLMMAMARHHIWPPTKLWEARA